jgi:4-aminobutyrate aminotransferase-like enzyme
MARGGSRASRSSTLRRGDLLPRVAAPPPGPEARRLLATLATAEAPGVNTVGGQGVTLWREARGANVLDVDGNRYLDFTSGFGAALVGHRHPRVVSAVATQARRLLHGLGDVHAHPARVALASALASRAPFPDARVYFAVSGADAVEVALQTALLATGRPGVVAFEGAYHGLSLGALPATSRPRFRRPFQPYLHRHVRRLPFGCSPGRLERALAGGGVGCLLVEPLQGREGVRLAPAGWLAEVAHLCGRHGVLFIADEILTGCGRVGPFSLAAAEGAVPDLLIVGKALGGGLPIAAVLGPSRIMGAWPAEGEALHTATFLAHPLACAAALAVLELLDDELAGRAEALAVALEEALHPLRAQPRVREVRGRGALWGVEVDREGLAARWAASALERGLLALPAGPDGRVLELLPALTTTPRQLAVAAAILRDSLQALTSSQRVFQRQQAPDTPFQA